MKNFTNVTKFKFIYFLVFFGDSIFGNFLALYLVNLQFSSYEKGTILAIVPIACFLGNLFFSYFGNDYKRNIILLKILSCTQFLSIFFFGYISNIYVIAALTFIFSFNNSSYFQIQDGTLSQSLRKYKKIYATVRVFGSIGYLVGLLFSSFVFDFINYKILFMISGIFFMLTFVFLFSLDLKDYILDNFDSSNKGLHKITSSSPKMLLKNKYFYFYLACYVLLWGGTTLNWNIYPLYLNSLGLKDNEFAMFQGLTVIFETIFMYLNILIYKKVKSYKAFLFIAAILKITAIIFEVTIPSRYPLAILCMVVNGVGSGFFVFSNVNFINEVFGEKDLTRVLQYVVGINNLFLGVGNILAPIIYTNISYQVFFLLVGFLEILGTVCLIFVKKEKTLAIE